MFSAHITELRKDRVPEELAYAITPAVWGDILSRFDRAAQDALCWSCAAELCCTCTTGFFLIFCCHPCIYNAVHRNCTGDQAATLNYTYFQRAPVVRFTEDGYLYIDLNAIPNTQQAPVTSSFYQPPQATVVTTAYGTPVMAEASVVVEQAAPTKHDVSPTAATAPLSYASSPPSKTSSAGAPRIIRVSLPEGGQPGQQVVVNTPDGQQVAVVLASTVAPGQTVDIQY